MDFRAAANGKLFRRQVCDRVLYEQRDENERHVHAVDEGSQSTGIHHRRQIQRITLLREGVPQHRMVS